MPTGALYKACSVVAALSKHFQTLLLPVCASGVVVVTAVVASAATGATISAATGGSRLVVATVVVSDAVMGSSGCCCFVEVFAGEGSQLPRTDVIIGRNMLYVPVSCFRAIMYIQKPMVAVLKKSWAQKIGLGIMCLFVLIFLSDIVHFQPRSHDGGRQ